MNRIMKEMIEDVKALDKGRKFISKKTKVEYGWHNPKFPPELRKACLSGKALQIDEKTHLYFLMCSWYERISGFRAPCNFEVYGNWKKKLLTGGKEEYGFTKKELDGLIGAIQAGTRFSKEKREVNKVLAALRQGTD